MNICIECIINSIEWMFVINVYIFVLNVYLNWMYVCIECIFALNVVLNIYLHCMYICIECMWLKWINDCTLDSYCWEMCEKIILWILLTFDIRIILTLSNPYSGFLTHRYILPYSYSNLTYCVIIYSGTLKL